MIWIKFGVMIAEFTMLLAAGPIDLSGLVRDTNGKPVPQAVINVFDGLKLLDPYPKSVGLDGRYHIHIDNFDRDHLILGVQANGFAPVKTTVTLSAKTVMVPPITLTVQPGLAIPKLQLDRGTDGTVDLAAIIRNESTENVWTTQAVILASKSRKIGCSDLRPALVFQVTVEKNSLIAVFEVPDENNSKEEHQMTGEYEDLPCNLARVRLTTNLRYRIAGLADKKLLIKLPATVQLAGPDGKHDANLGELNTFVLRLTLEDGRTFDSRL